jgi:hypothetical protein
MSRGSWSAAAGNGTKGSGLMRGGAPPPAPVGVVATGVVALDVEGIMLDRLHG